MRNRLFVCACALVVATAICGCGDDDFSQRPVDAAVGPDAQTDCTGVTTACLANRGSTMMEDVRLAEGGLSDKMADILLAQGSIAAGEPIDVAILNGGAIRGGANLGPPDFEWSSDEARIGRYYGPGPITEADIRGWFPFRDDHVVMTLTGAQLKRSLEHGVSNFADDAGLNFGANLQSGDSAGHFLHVAGMRFEVTCPGTTRIEIGPPDCSPSQGTCMYLNADQANSVSKIEIGATVIYDAAAGGWQGTGETDGVRVIMNSFVADSNDNHLDFILGTERVTISLDDWDYVEVLINDFTNNTPMTLSVDGRMTVIGTVHGIACNLPESCTPAHQDFHPNCAHL